MSSPAREPDDRTPLIDQESPAPPAQWQSFLDKTRGKIIIGLAFFVILVLAAGLTVFLAIRNSPSPIPSTKELTSCAWDSLQSQVYILDVEPIGRTEFLNRQARLAATLEKEGVDAYITEPSASSLYYFNISASYSLSERPFLAILSSNGSFSYLAPEFELGRIAGLDMVYKEKTIIEWKEEESPYAALKRESGNGISNVMVDEQARFFITSGLEAANFTVLPVSPPVTSIRAVKSDTELEILQAINMYTLQVVRSLQKCIQVGITQESLFDAAHSLFTRAGVGLGFWAVVLFGEQAANPHGGSMGKTLEDGEFVLIDIGSKLYGYNSDVTRTILPTNSFVSQQLMDVWHLVRDAQEVAVRSTSEGTLCSAVDAASRYAYYSSYCCLISLEDS